MNAFLLELTHVNIYKRSQGRITRQVTCVAISLVVALGLWRLMVTLQMAPWEWVKSLNTYGFQYWLPGLLLVAGLWIAYRLVNFPAFADFLIAVEAEMNKVSWPSRAALFRASMVVLFTIFFLAAVLFGLDTFWRWFFGILNVFPQNEAAAASFDFLAMDWQIFLL